MKKAAFALALCVIAVPTMAMDLYHPAVGTPHQGPTPPDACWTDAPDLNGLIGSSEQILTYGLESEIANDFVPDFVPPGAVRVSHLTVWTGYWNNSTPCATGIAFPGLNIRVYDDAGCIPGTILYDVSPTVTETSYGCQSGFYPMFQDDMDVSFSLISGNLYWLGAQLADHVFPPQGGRLASVGVQACDSVIKSAYFGYPNWTSAIDALGVSFDASQQFVCSSIPTGACCFTYGYCSVCTQDKCEYHGGSYQGDGTTCNPNPCPQPTGACCNPTTGDCTVTTRVNCSHTWHGEWTTCDPNPCPPPGSNSIYYVRSDGSGASPPYFPTIQAAINYVGLVNGDVIELIGTPFTGVGNRDVNFNGRLVTVRSQSGDPDQCVIDCQGVDRGFTFSSGENSQAILEAITITNGYMNNPGSGGGGIYISSSSPSIRDSKIVSCHADEMSSGGGLCVVANSFPFLTDCTIANCSAGTWRYPAAGGGIASGGTSYLVMRNCIISSNTSESNSQWDDGNGGGVCCASGNLSNCEIRGNSARHGGGVAVGTGGVGVTLESCVIAANGAEVEGGGISGTNLTITNCTITGNSGGSMGGGVSSGGGLQFMRTILWGNCAPQGPDGDGSGMTFTCCDVNPANLSGTYTFNGLQVFADPRFCAPEPCGGGVNGDYHLGAGSPCLPQASPCHDLIGALGQGCPPSGTEDLAHGAAVGLMPGRPNPFVDETAIVFGLAKVAVVDLAIYDVGGRCVRRLASRTPYVAGVHQLIWNRSDDAGRLLPSGVYVCRLRAGEQVTTSRLVVLR